MLRILFVLGLLVSIALPLAAQSDMLYISAIENGVAYNVQIDGYDVIAYGDGMIKEVVADTIDIDYRIKVLPDMSVVAITPDGELHPVVANMNGIKLPVIAVNQKGHTLDLKAVQNLGETAKFFGVKAFGQNDNTCHIKGIDILEDAIEHSIYGIEYYAHVKAICFSNN